MPEYLSKEEIRKWRSSLERITLEEYAARLGKVVQEEKHDDSLVDSVILKSLNSMTVDNYSQKTEKIHSIALKSFAKEKEIAKKKEAEIKPLQAKKKEMPKEEKTVETKQTEEVIKETVAEMQSDINFSFKKALTAREQLVFNHFLENKNTIVYAKDLAQILDLPRDYVYKYIKNLRSKLNEDILQNADNGGYLLKV